MFKQIDARGLSCPQPVIVAKKAIDNGEFPIEVLVETTTSLENIKRMAEKASCVVEVENVGDEFKVTLKK